jgi:hypothetical protein
VDTVGDGVCAGGEGLEPFREGRLRVRPGWAEVGPLSVGVAGSRTRAGTLREPRRDGLGLSGAGSCFPLANLGAVGDGGLGGKNSVFGDSATERGADAGPPGPPGPPPRPPRPVRAPLPPRPRPRATPPRKLDELETSPTRRQVDSSVRGFLVTESAAMCEPT